MTEARFEHHAYLHACVECNLGDDLLVDMLLERFPGVEWAIPVYEWCLPEGYSPEASFGTHRNALFKLQRGGIVGRIDRLGCILMGTEKRRSSLDAYVSLGGSMYMESPRWEKELSAERERIASCGKGARSFVINSNFGPFASPAYRTEYEAHFAQFEDICFRDLESKKLFSCDIRVAPDAVFALSKERFARGNLGTVVSVVSYKSGSRRFYREENLRLLVELIESAPAEARPITLMAFCTQEGDLDAANEVIDALSPSSRTACRVYAYKGNIEEAVSVLSSSRYVVGGRFHSMILGLVFDKPTVVLSYSKKIESEVEYLRGEGYLKGSDCVINSERFADVHGGLIWEMLQEPMAARVTRKCRSAAEGQFDGLRHLWAED